MVGALSFLIYAFLGVLAFALAAVFGSEWRRNRAALDEDAKLLEKLAETLEKLKAPEAEAPASQEELLDRVVDQLSGVRFPMDLYAKDASKRAEVEKKLREILRTPIKERSSDSGQMGGAAPPIVEPPQAGPGRPAGPGTTATPGGQLPVIFYPEHDPITGKIRWRTFDLRFGFDIHTQREKEEEKS